MSLQLPTILSPPTPCTPGPTLTVSPQVRSRSCRSPFPGRLPFWASPSLSRLANASGRIEFIIFLIMDWSFASGCSPPRLSATQFPSATDSQCSVRWGLPPHCWCALSGALSEASRFASLKRSPFAVTYFSAAEGIVGDSVLHVIEENLTAAELKHAALRQIAEESIHRHRPNVPIHAAR